MEKRIFFIVFVFLIFGQWVKAEDNSIAINLFDDSVKAVYFSVDDLQVVGKNTIIFRLEIYLSEKGKKICYLALMR